MKQITLNIPDDWRIGQYIFNLLDKIQQDNPKDNSQMIRCADTFHILDEEFSELVNRFNEAHK